MPSSNALLRNLGVTLVSATGAAAAVLLIGSSLRGASTSTTGSTLPSGATTVVESGTTLPLGVDSTATDDVPADGGVSLPQGGTAVPQTTKVEEGQAGPDTTQATGGSDVTLPADTTAPGMTAPTGTAPMPVQIAGPSNVVERRPIIVQPDGGVFVVWVVKGSDTARAFTEVEAQLLASGWVELQATMDSGDFRTDTRFAAVFTQVNQQGNTDVGMVVYS